MARARAGQRDWPGFFAALLAFMQQVVPLIAQYFVKGAATSSAPVLKVAETEKKDETAVS